MKATLCKSLKITQYLIDIRNFFNPHKKYIQKKSKKEIKLIKFGNF